MACRGCDLVQSLKRQIPILTRQPEDTSDLAARDKIELFYPSLQRYRAGVAFGQTTFFRRLDLSTEYVGFLHGRVKVANSVPYWLYARSTQRFPQPDEMYPESLMQLTIVSIVAVSISTDVVSSCGPFTSSAAHV